MLGRAETLVRKRTLTHTIPVSIDLTNLAAQRATDHQLIAAHGAPDGLVH
ncbi:MAG: hypothetical protein H7343_02890 [Undibacterium sp.]|nr:hypothetical protein [Opitutaceae bacterium]